MRHRLHFSVAAALLAVASHAAAATPWIMFMTPRDGTPVMGELEVSVAAGPEGLVQVVEFVVDGQPVGSLSQPPYDFVVDLGGDNITHIIEAVARTRDGAEARTRITTQPVPIAAEYAVELQQLYVTVTRDGVRVLNLDREAFKVTDEGDAQEIVTFAQGELPFTASILIDTSASMQGDKLDAAVAGARAFLNGMQPLDQVQVTVFSDSLKIHTPIGAGREVMMTGLGWVQARGGTAIADHLWASLRLLETRQGRRVVVLLSDGIDTHSVLPMKAALNAARRSQTLVYWIRLEGRRGAHRGSLSSAWRDPAGYREQLSVLERVVSGSGGRIIPVRSATEIEAVFLSILAELREQYVLGYYPTDRRDDGSWRRVRVSLVDEDGAVRTSRGYVDY
jgi:Ca-activated chloride channel family protein